MTTPLTPGWYPDPSGKPEKLYWDGLQWHTAPPAAPSWGGPSVKKRKVWPWVLLGVLVLFFGGCFAFVGIIGSSIDKSTHQSGLSASSQRPATVPPGASMPGIGQEARDGNLTFTVTGVDEKDSLGASKPRGRFVIVNVTVKNTSKQEHSFQVNDQMLIGSNGAKYRADWMAATSINDENTLLLTLGPGFSAQYRFPFDLPSDIMPSKVEMHESAFSGGAIVKLS